MVRVLIKKPSCARSKEQSELMNLSSEHAHWRRSGSGEPRMRNSASILAAMVCRMSLR